MSFMVSVFFVDVCPNEYFFNLRSYKHYRILLSTKGFFSLLSLFQFIFAWNCFCDVKLASYLFPLPHMDILCCSSTVYWKDCPFPTKLHCHLCHKSNAHIHVGFFLGSGFCFIALLRLPDSTSTSAFSNPTIWYSLHSFKYTTLPRCSIV